MEISIQAWQQRNHNHGGNANVSNKQACFNVVLQGFTHSKNYYFIITEHLTVFNFVYLLVHSIDSCNGQLDRFAVCYLSIQG